MGQVIQPQDGGGSGGSASSSSLVLATSRFAINTNDVVILGLNGLAYAAQTVNYAAVPAAQAGQGSSINSGQTLASSGFDAANDVKQSIYFDPATLRTYVAYPTLASNAGLRVLMSSPDNTPLATLVLDAAAAATVGGINIFPLSDGNLVVIWGTLNTGQYYAIINKSLGIVLAKTAFGVAQTSGPFIHAAALSGGGFAIAYSGTAGAAALLAVFTNAGAVTLAPTVIAGSPTGDARPRIAQLSNGNLAVVIASTTAANAITRSIFTAAGGVVAANAVVDAGTKAVITTPDIAVLPNVFAVTANVAGNIKAYVQSNAGVTQGTAVNDAASSTAACARIIHDGTSFWLFYAKAASTAGIIFLPVTGGATAIVYAQTSTNGSVPDTPDLVYDRDILIGGTIIGYMAFSVTQAGALAMYLDTTTTSQSSNLPCTLKIAGDFGVYKLQTQTSHYLNNWRYMSMSLIGVARSSVAAGSPGTLLSVNVGPASVLVNPLPGTPSKAYVFTTAAIVGNNGVLLNNSISMKGI